jgi:hypothetical protein
MNFQPAFRPIIILFILAAFGSCKSTIEDPTLTVKTIGEDQLMTINFKEIKDSIQINLSAFAADFEVVPLETRPECLLKYALCLISNKYILCNAGEAGILQFSRDGKFIRKLVSYGKGPIEVERSPQWAVDEENQILFLTTFGKAGYFMSFSLTTGSYLNNIPNAVPSYARHMFLTTEGEILCVPYKKPDPDQPSCLLYRQTREGELTGKINGPANLVIQNGSTLYQHEDDFRFSQRNDDTLYNIKNDILIPFLAYNYGEPNPIGTENVGYKTTRVIFEAQNYIFLSHFKITSVTRNESGYSSGGSVAWLCLDKGQKKVFLMKDIYNDFIGSGIQSQSVFVQGDGTVFMAYQAVDLLEIAEKVVADPKTPAILRQRLEKISREVKPDDNPVLIVGKLKR